MNDDIRKELIEYYKWIVNIEMFVLTTVVALISAVSRFHFSIMLLWGIGLLGISMFFNWLLIKRLVTQPIVEKVMQEGTQRSLHKIFVQSKGLMGVYGVVQNWAFIIGIALIFFSFILGKNLPIIYPFPR